jgi:hypothetical protein
MCACSVCALSLAECCVENVWLRWPLISAQIRATFRLLIRLRAWLIADRGAPPPHSSRSLPAYLAFGADDDMAVRNPIDPAHCTLWRTHHAAPLNQRSPARRSDAPARSWLDGDGVSCWQGKAGEARLPPRPPPPCCLRALVQPWVCSTRSGAPDTARSRARARRTRTTARGGGRRCCVCRGTARR